MLEFARYAQCQGIQQICVPPCRKIMINTLMQLVDTKTNPKGGMTPTRISTILDGGIIQISAMEIKEHSKDINLQCKTDLLLNKGYNNLQIQVCL